MTKPAGGIEPNEVLIGLFMLHVSDALVEQGQLVVVEYREACRRGDAYTASRWEGRLKAWLKERGEHVD
jgi:hypothetical protein